MGNISDFVRMDKTLQVDVLQGKQKSRLITTF